MPKPYDPCPCGSGKKYKFCCKQLQNERQQPHLRVLSSEDIPLSDHLEDSMMADLQESQRLNSRAIKLMAENRIKEAITLLKKTSLQLPLFPAAENNLALCHFLQGDIHDAIRTQQAALEHEILPNSFGWASLAVYLLAADREEEAHGAIENALTRDMPSSDSCAKVCEALARFERHEDILALAKTNPEWSKDSGINFFAGVAAANLGRNEEAIAYLRRVHSGHHKADTAKRYLDWLKSDTPPNTIRRNWPYLHANEICPFEVLKNLLSNSEDSGAKARIGLQAAETFVNESLNNPVDAVKLIGASRHPDAIPLLWTIVKGTVGPDQLRLQAMTQLHERGEVDRTVPVEIYLKGKYETITHHGTRLNPDFRFGPPLPPKLDRRFEAAVKSMSKSEHTWETRGQEFKEIATAAPDFYPAWFNYAVCLLHSNKSDEAEPILRKLVNEHPDYLFARAGLVQLYLRTDRSHEARELIKTTDLPEETHPTAMSQWMVAQTLFHANQKEFDSARRSIEFAHSIDPDNQVVNRLYRQITRT